MAFIGVIALVVIGPERLPGVARTVGLWVGKARRMVADIKADVKKEMNEYDLQQVRDLKQEITSASDELKDISSGTDDDPLGLKEVGEQIKGTTEELNQTLDVGKADGSPDSKKKAAKKSKKKSSAKKSTTKKSTAKKSASKKTSGKKPKSSKTAAKAGKKSKTRKSVEVRKGKKEATTKSDKSTGGSTA